MCPGLLTCVSRFANMGVCVCVSRFANMGVCVYVQVC